MTKLFARPFLTCPAVALLFAVPLTTDPVSGQGAPGQVRRTRIEQRTPGVFDDSGSDALAEHEVRYQVNATVRIPLLFGSIPLVSRDEVGVGSFTVRDFAAEGTARLRAYEFFAVSIPERSRGLHRLGFMREVVHLGLDGAHWTAQFGVISGNAVASRDETDPRQERESHVQSYTALDAFTDPTRTTNDRVAIDLDGRWLTASELYADVRPLWGHATPDQTTTYENRARRGYVQPVAFLGALQHSLRIVAADIARRREPRKFRYPYVHGGALYFLELQDHQVDTRRQRVYIEVGLVGPDAVVHRMRYRLVDGDGKVVQPFELWAELPTRFGPLSPPIMPIAFEFRARSFLDLKAVQVLGHDR